MKLRKKVNFQHFYVAVLAVFCALSNPALTSAKAKTCYPSGSGKEFGEKFMRMSRIEQQIHMFPELPFERFSTENTDGPGYYSGYFAKSGYDRIALPTTQGSDASFEQKSFWVALSNSASFYSVSRGDQKIQLLIEKESRCLKVSAISIVNIDEILFRGAAYSAPVNSSEFLPKLKK